MLPVGVTFGLVSVIGSAAMLFFAIPALFLATVGAASWWTPLWCLGGGAALAWAAGRSIEVVSAFDWRPLPGVLAAVGLTAAASPFLW